VDDIHIDDSDLIKQTDPIKFLVKLQNIKQKDISKPLIATIVTHFERIHAEIEELFSLGK
jgi:hypothetical protein